MRFDVWVAFIIAGAVALVLTGAGFLLWENRDRIG